VSVNYEVSQLAAQPSPASGDLLLTVDVSDTATAPAGPAGSDKKLTLATLLSWIVSQITGFANVIGFTAGTDTSGTATASTPALTSGTAAQLSTVQDCMLYCDVKVASTFALSAGPTSSPATAIVASATAGVGCISVRVPKGWYVKATFTSADVVFTQVTC
jgi:hypothetical protein